MAVETYYNQFDHCLQSEPPFCEDACPFRVNVLAFQDKMKAGRYNPAYKELRKAMAFPAIASALCPGICEQACVRSKLDDPVQLHRLEQTCLAGARRKDPPELNLPARKKTAAVIGGGAAGLACTIKLAAQKYAVTIFERGSRVGGSLYEQLPEELVEADLALQFKYEEYELRSDREITSLEEVDDFDAVLIATGAGGSDFGIEESVFEEGGRFILAGGGVHGLDALHAMAFGIRAAEAIDYFFRTGRGVFPQPPEPTKIVFDTSFTESAPAVAASGENGLFTDEEARAEAQRCLRCRCNPCQVYCDLSPYMGKWPREMRDDILFSTKAGESLVSKSPAKRLISTGNQTGIFEEVCPAGIDLDSMLKESRYLLHQQNKTPGGWHQFWIRDMEFSNGPCAALSIAPQPREDVAGGRARAFFPGCWLGSAHPDYVIRPYLWLREHAPGTGLLLRCCGIPADWAGEEDLHEEEIDKLRQEWEAIGSPQLIVACPSCMQHLRDYLPQIPLISLYEVLRDEGFETPAGGTLPGHWAVFDPCQARHDEGMKAAVRELAAASAETLDELPGPPGCCGYGGIPLIADDEYVDYVNEKRAAQSDDPYLVYCINCRDIFRDHGKPVRHILGALFDVDSDDSAEPPTETQRRRNKVIVKERLMKEVLNMEMKEKPAASRYRLVIPPEVQKKMDGLRLLESDLCDVLDVGEQHGRRTVDPENGHYKCYRELGSITCWVEYAVDGDTYTIVNLYTHRMHIELEEVFNGRKTEIIV